MIGEGGAKKAPCYGIVATAETGTERFSCRTVATAGADAERLTCRTIATAGTGTEVSPAVLFSHCSSMTAVLRLDG